MSVQSETTEYDLKVFGSVMNYCVVPETLSVSKVKCYYSVTLHNWGQPPWFELYAIITNHYPNEHVPADSRHAIW